MSGVGRERWARRVRGGRRPPGGGNSAGDVALRRPEVGGHPGPAGPASFAKASAAKNRQSADLSAEALAKEKASAKAGGTALPCRGGVEPDVFVGVVVEEGRIPALDAGLDQEDVGVIVDGDDRGLLEKQGFGLFP